MAEATRVFRWDGFRMMRPLPEDPEELLAMFRQGRLGFSFADDPALYVRKALDRLQAGDGLIDTGGREGQPARIDWHGFPDAVRKYLGDEAADKARGRLAAMAGGSESGN
jgi:hypothetical protein